MCFGSTACVLLGWGCLVHRTEYTSVERFVVMVVPVLGDELAKSALDAAPRDRLDLDPPGGPVSRAGRATTVFTMGHRCGSGTG